MTKSKSSTIAIVVLSVLLAAALASTIVLAAFTNSKSATTTITFANGIELTLSGNAVAVAEGEGDTDYVISLNKNQLTESVSNLLTSDGVKAAVSNADAWLQFTITPTVSSGFTIARTSATGTAGTWTISKASTPVATLVITGAGVAAYNGTETNAVDYVTTSKLTANDPAVQIISSIAVTVASGQDNNVAGLSITVPAQFDASAAQTNPYHAA